MDAIVIIILFATLISSVRNENVQITVTQGTLEGRILNSTNGRQFFAFRGVPYAQPPIGELRFKRPLPVLPHEGMFNATVDGNACPQIDFKKFTVTGNEDCLILNVYTPVLPSESNPSQNLPVLVYLHGGGFVLGSSSSLLYGPERFMNKDVVLVTLNSRLGAVGFLSTGDENSVGNFGQYDQTQALKWVQENIASFGGDKTRVTLFGVSAGGSMASTHLLSPISKGLFHNVIAQSGSLLSRWAINPNPMQIAQDLAKSVNCTTENNAAMVECLRGTNISDIVNYDLGNTKALMKGEGEYKLAWAPTVETHNEEIKAIPHDALTLVQTGSLNADSIITGYNQNEGGLTIGFFEKFFNLTDKMEDYNNILPLVVNQLHAFLHQPKEEIEPMARRAFEAYNITADTPIPEAQDKLSELFGDVMFVNGSEWLADELMKRGDIAVRKYVFDHEVVVGLVALMLNVTIKGTSHGDEMLYQFTTALYPHPLQDKHVTTSENILRMWTNYAANSDPMSDFNETWTPITPTAQSYLRIADTLRNEQGTFNQENLHVWQDQ